MLKSNSKKARENVRAYIMQDSDYVKESYSRILNTEDEVLATMFDIFCSEMRYSIEANYNNPHFGIFLDWARGLALGGLFCYYYNRSAVDDLGAILEETEEEKAHYTERQAEEWLSRMIYRELEDAWRKQFIKNCCK